MTPIRTPSRLQRLAWIEPEQLECIKDAYHPDGTLMFRRGETYLVEPHLTTVRWREDKPTATGETMSAEFSGQETAFRIFDVGGHERWFVEQRLGRRVVLTPISDHDFTFQELLEHFEPPAVNSIAESRPQEYREAIERIKCLTQN